jgi:hypothetical protein
MKIRSRDAWLATIAAALGASEIACNKDAKEGPAVAREVPSASTSATVAASAPSETASAEVVASASAAPSATASAAPTSTKLVGGAGTGIGHMACGRACGASSARMDPQPNVTLNMLGPPNNDDLRVVQSGLRARIRSCAIDAAKKDSNTQGNAILTIAVDAHGAVTRVDAQDSGLGEAVACMKSAARNVKFSEGAARTIRVDVRVDRSF